MIATFYFNPRPKSLAKIANSAWPGAKCKILKIVYHRPSSKDVTLVMRMREKPKIGFLYISVLSKISQCFCSNKKRSYQAKPKITLQKKGQE